MTPTKPYIVALLGAAALVATPQPAFAAVSCRIITHRAVAPQLDEEQPGGVAYSTRFRWGAEIDARLSKDGTPWAVHDSGLGRITGGADKRKVIDLTDAELRAVKLAKGSRPYTVRALFKKAAAVGARLLVELKPVPPGATTRWASAPDGQPTGLDQLATAAADTGAHVFWTTSRPNVWDNLTGDDRFDGDLTAKPFAWTVGSAAGLRQVYLDAARTTAAVVRALVAVGVVPIRHVGARSTAATLRAGVRTVVSHYPVKTRNTCRRYTP